MPSSSGRGQGSREQAVPAVVAAPAGRVEVQPVLSLRVEAEKEPERIGSRRERQGVGDQVAWPPGLGRVAAAGGIVLEMDTAAGGIVEVDEDVPRVHLGPAAPDE